MESGGGKVDEFKIWNLSSHLIGSGDILWMKSSLLRVIDVVDA